MLKIKINTLGTVDNNLGPRALDQNCCRQPTLVLHDICLEVLTLHGNELGLFGAKTLTYSYSFSLKTFTSLAMTRFRPIIKPITSPTLGRCTTYYRSRGFTCNHTHILDACFKSNLKTALNLSITIHPPQTLD